MIACPGCSKLSPNDAKRCGSCGYSLVATTRIVKAVSNPYQPPATQSPGVLVEDAPKSSMFHPSTLATIIGVGSIVVGVLNVVMAKSINLLSLAVIMAFILGGIGMMRGAKWGLMAVRVATTLVFLLLMGFAFLICITPGSPPTGVVVLVVLIGGFEGFALYHLILNHSLKALYE